MRQNRDDAAITISADDAQAAVDLLEGEQDVGQSLTRRKISLEFANDLLVGAVFFFLPVGLTVVWLDLWVGVGLLVALFVSFVLLGALPRSGVDDDAEKIKRALASVEAIQDWTNRLHWSETMVLVGGLLWFGGVVWMIWVAVADGTVGVVAVALVAVGSAVVALSLAFDSVLEYRYLVRVGRALGRIRERANRTDTGTVVISGAERAVLAEAQTQQVKRAVDESIKQLPDVLAEAYAVVVAPEALDSLRALAAESPEEWLTVTETISSLQENPQPDSSLPVEGDAADRVIRGAHDVRFRVDEPDHRVYVVSVAGEPGGSHGGA